MRSKNGMLGVKHMTFVLRCVWVMLFTASGPTWAQTLADDAKPGDTEIQVVPEFEPLPVLDSDITFSRSMLNGTITVLNIWYEH